MSWFCKHGWELREKELLPSAHEQLTASKQALKRADSTVAIFQKTLVLVFTCAKCGKLKKIVVRSPK